MASSPPDGPGFRNVDPVFIPLSDGTRLAARLWLPADRAPAPAILEALPYRRNDGTLIIDHPRYSWWAQHGFAGVRVDLRGTGDSDGVLTDEYLRLEQDDNLEILAWIAEQPWSNGRVGMVGFSWGGFASLQTAARRPPELAAIVTVNSVVRRYTDDCHYTGGAVNAYDLLSWASTMYAYDARPPDPEVVGGRWREMWTERLAVRPPMIEPWLTHQLEDDYWRHGSVHFDYAALDVPILAVGGWADPYRNAVLDLVDHRPDLTTGIIGPWAHGYPQATRPGPQIDFLGECATFFDRHLRPGTPLSAPLPPPVRLYVQEYDDPRTPAPTRPGRWVGLGASAAADWFVQSIAPATITDDHRCGAAAGTWCPYGETTLAGDQRDDDSHASCSDSEPLVEFVDVAGFPSVRLTVIPDRPHGIIAVRLCDVAPDGTSLLVTRGVLNLTHLDGHDRLRPLVPGEPIAVELRLDAAAHRFGVGHRIRAAVSAGYWPWIWPTPTPTTLHIVDGHIRLPLLAADAAQCDLGEPRQGEAISIRPLSEPADESQPDFLLGRLELVDLGIAMEESGANTYEIEHGDPLTARARVTRRVDVSRPDWETSVEVDSVMTCSATEFFVTTTLRASLNGEVVESHEHITTVARTGG